MAERGGTKLAALYAEIDLDRSKLDKALDQTVSDAELATVKIEKAWKGLGLKTEEWYERQRLAAKKNYEKITADAQLSANERISIEAAYTKKIESIHNKQYAVYNQQWDTLGIRSTQSIQKQIDNVKAAAIATQSTVAKNSQDWINIERAKNEKIKQLNKEMVGEHEVNMANMVRVILRAYAAWYVVSNAVRQTAIFIMSGVKAIDDLKISTVAVAAQLTSIQGNTGDVTENYKKNLAYSQALVPVLQDIDAQSFANLSQIEKMNMAMVNQGVLLDVNNQKQVKAFTALTNAVAMFTQGQDQERQAAQEIRALMTGQVRAGNMVAMQMDALIRKEGIYRGGLKELVKEGQKHGDTLERMMPYLAGIIAAASDIQKTWAAIGSSLETAWTILQRGLFKNIYKDVIAMGASLNEFLRTNKEGIIKFISDLYERLSNVVIITSAALGTFATVGWLSTMKVGTATTWLSGLWDMLNTKITLTSNKLKMLPGVFTAALGGYMFGEWLNKFEIVRTFGVNMVYSLIAGWKKFVFVLKQGWYGLKMILPFTDKEAAKKDLDEATKEYDRWLADHDQKWTAQLLSVKTKHEDIFAIVPKEAPKTPLIKAGKGLEQSFKAQSDALEALKKKHKSYFDSMISSADNYAKLSRKQGEQELDVIDYLYASKIKLLDDYLEVQYKEAEEEVKLAKLKADKNDKEFNADAVLKAKKEAILAEYYKRVDKLNGDMLIDIEKYNEKHISVVYDAYNTINEYSKNSYDLQREKLIENYRDKLRYVRKESEEELAVRMALEKEINNINIKMDRDKLSLYEKIKLYAYDSSDIIEKLAQEEYDKAYKLTQDRLIAEKAFTEFYQDEQIKRAKSSEDVIEGAKAGIVEYYKKSMTWGEAAANAINNTFSTATDSLVEFLTTGKTSITDFLQAILKDLIRIMVQMTIMKPIAEALMGTFNGSTTGFGLSNIIGWFSGSLSGVSSTASTVTSTVGTLNNFKPFTAINFVGSALGNIFEDRFLKKFASGGIVSSPTVFPFANGIGLMGEAGTEAIMPLGRNSSGELGVKTTNKTNNNNPIININIMAADAKSFKDMCGRNQSAIVEPILKALNNNNVRLQMKGLLA